MSNEKDNEEFVEELTSRHWRVNKLHLEKLHCVCDEAGVKAHFILKKVGVSEDEIIEILSEEKMIPAAAFLACAHELMIPIDKLFDVKEEVYDE